jgi:hypothetical protein
LSRLKEHARMDEKRSESRIKVNWPIEIYLDDGTIEGIARNITLKGLFVCCQEPLYMKKDYRLQVFTPDKKAINVVGKAVWSDSYAIDEENAPVCIGLSFVKISNEDLDLLKEVVDKFRRIG